MLIKSTIHRLQVKTSRTYLRMPNRAHLQESGGREGGTKLIPQRTLQVRKMRVILAHPWQIYSHHRNLAVKQTVQFIPRASLQLSRLTILRLCPRSWKSSTWDRPVWLSKVLRASRMRTWSFWCYIQWLWQRTRGAVAFFSLRSIEMTCAQSSLMPRLKAFQISWETLSATTLSKNSLKWVLMSSWDKSC